MYQIIKRIHKLLGILKSPYTFKALMNGSAAALEHINLLSSIQSRCVVDIGANRGQFALACRKSLPEAIIYSIEPLQEPLEYFAGFLRMTYKLNYSSARLAQRNV